jgi:ribosomal protein S18 acetylase RimI-like enzyme
MEPDPAPARPDELPAAFRLLFDDLPAEERDGRIARVLSLIEHRELSPDGVFVVRGPIGVLGALVCQPVAGAGALVWPPRSVDDSHRHEREDRLIQEAARWLRQRSVKLAQALLTAEETPLAAPLERNGFVHVTHLWYLRSDLSTYSPPASTPAALEYRPFDPNDLSLFARTLQRTYEDTLDCPEVNGVRTMEEVIAGHQAQGRFDPGRWWLLLREDRPVGVLLLVELPEGGTWEVAYMGLIPEARRQGLGRALLRKARHEALAAGIAHLILSVDGRNLPAWNLYRGLGFEPFDRREVYLALWPK